MITTSSKGQRYMLEPYRRHESWNLKLLRTPKGWPTYRSIPKYYSNDKEELARKIVELACFFYVPTEAFSIRDTILQFDIVYTTQGQFIGRDRLPSS